MKTKARRGFAVLAVLSIAFGGGLIAIGCERDTPSQTQPSEIPQSLPTVKMKIKDRTYDLEVARTPRQQEIGLMKRDSMPENHGMIFCFDAERPLSFWMKDTRIPLDILYLAADGKVVSVATMQPYDLSPVPSDVPAQYAIELNAGQIKKLGVTVGDVLDIPQSARSSNKPAATQP